MSCICLDVRCVCACVCVPTCACVDGGAVMFKGECQCGVCVCVLTCAFVDGVAVMFKNITSYLGECVGVFVLTCGVRVHVCAFPCLCVCVRSVHVLCMCVLEMHLKAYQYSAISFLSNRLTEL